MPDLWLLAAIYFLLKCVSEFEAERPLAGGLAFLFSMVAGILTILTYSSIS